MPEDKAVHPGSFVGDSIEEWKKLPTWGKVAVGVVLAVVAYLAWRAHNQTAQHAAASTAASPDTSGTGTVAGTQSPFPNVNGLPLLPNNVNPVLDANGNPIAYQQAPMQTPTNPTSPTQTGVPDQPTGLPLSPVVNTNNPLPTNTTMNSPASTTPHISTGYIPLWQQLHVPGPIIPSGKYQGPSFSNLKPGTTYTYNGTKYTLSTSVKGEPGSGLLYGTNPQGQTVALYGPASAYHP